MPFRGKRSNRGKSTKPRRTFKQNKGKVVSLGTKKYVKNMISRNTEKKVYIQNSNNVDLPSANLSTPPTFIQLMPTLAQGDSQSQRTGNQVMVKSAVIRGRVNMKPVNSVTNSNASPSLVKIWLCRRKRTNTYITGIPTIAQFNNFFQTGSSSGGFTALPVDMFAPVNDDYWDVLGVRNFQLGGAQAIFTASHIASGATQVSIPYTFYFNKYLGKLMYNDNNTEPVNKELYLVYQVVYADGTSSALQVQCETHYSIKIEYTDA
jgi:hypothetical protein